MRARAQDRKDRLGRIRWRDRRGARGTVLGLAACVLVGLAGPGCIRRTVTITTDPQGAEVTLNDQQVGTSPVSVDFTWHGDYDVILRREGYETLRTHRRLNAPWYELPVIDLFAGLMPFEIHDRQYMDFTLEPARPVDREALLQDASAMRERALYEQESGGSAATQPGR